ncbi:MULTISPECIES: zinc ribbon domain-containing protein [unclassified Dysgonomonas]|uniref:zinc ribbon domain-containing protein n=1 Tax=unclassified Dysgonomonas TaxID=2630389 RepID=UPI00067FF0C9|nr:MULTISPECIES: zinc ribbon domain-containing protein [unclassified Dysgonomonas]MBD8347163.1 zinc ribbon domain-containing protein [Dysgonomonas sp. HGC4]MBF0574920.1 zinc ribbon domain-containing protein [Dysgonomonas sp. GY617]
MEQTFCQSCGMPMSAEFNSTNKDGSVNTTYCSYCYKDGAFTSDVTMDEMILKCAEYVDEFNKDSDIKYTKEEAIAGMKQHFPTLLRWRS